MDEQERKRQIREAWRRARDEMREAFRTTWQEGWVEDATGRRENFEAFMQNLATKAREFGRDVGEEARRFGHDFTHDARKQADEAWKGVREEWSERQRGHHGRGPAGRHEHWLLGGRRFQHWAGGDEDANPFLAAMMSKGGGLLSVYVLHLLSEQPRHGNDLMKEIESRTLGGWTSNPGAVYPLLSDMESNGLVVSNWEEPDKRTRRTYQITDSGREQLGRLKQVLRPKLMDTIDVLHDMYDDLYSSPDAGPSDKGDAAEQDQATAPVDEATPAADVGTPLADEDTMPAGEGSDEGSQTTKPDEGSSASLVRTAFRALLDRVLGPSTGRAMQAGG